MSIRTGLVVGMLGMIVFGAEGAPVPRHLMPKDSGCFYPTQVGTKWVFEVGGREETWVLASVENKEGGKLITTEYDNPKGKRTPHQKIWVKDDGVFLTQEGGHDYDKPWCICKLPHEDGQVWDATFQRGGPPTPSSMKSIAIEEIEVPAGRFRCTRVQWTLGGITDYWYASGVGLVKMDNPRLVLKSFSLGKG